jgi:murein DD-endopeptidase MepM/ murein hydrolase activator NlpD
MIRTLTFLALALNALAAAPMGLRLPTDNRFLLSGEPEKFYMYVDRTVEGKAVKAWEGGQFGMVRSAILMNGQSVFTHFHEGIDIAPIRRDRAGNPLDTVTSVADGTVAHVSPLAGRSNYGKYVVVLHRWDDSDVYSLYAHLAEISCKQGDAVKAGDALGRMGFTGVGINRTRAHVHLEIGLVMSTRFDDWEKANGVGINYHGNYNGLNLTGIDVSRLYREHQKNPELQFSQFVAATPVHFKVLVPVPQAKPDLVNRYPWLLHGSTEGAVSWEISFSAVGCPLALAASQQAVTAPTVSQICAAEAPQRYLTRGLVSGEGDKATLTLAGKKLVSLLMDDFPVVPVAAESATGKKKEKAKDGGA